jgi:hypothetical protein
MSNNEENKSESINLENEQIEQRTLNSDEERKIKPNEESKTNTFQKKPKVRKNKSQNQFGKTKTKLPPISKSRKDPIYAGQRENTTNSIFSTSYRAVNIDPKDNDELYLDLHIWQKEIKKINRELKSLQKEYKLLEESIITNKYIIEKILNIQDDDNNENINVENNNEKIEDDKNNDINEDRNKNISKKKVKKIETQSEESKKILALKKQINLYDDTLQLNVNKLEELKKKKKQIQYQQLVNSLDGKNREISELMKKVNELNGILYENDTKIKFYSLRAQQYSDDIIQMEQKMKFENGAINENQTEIKNYVEKKENLNNKQKVLEDDLKQSEKKKEEIREETKK